MVFDIITIFPDTLQAISNESILRRAQDAGHIAINIHDLREWTTDERRTIDDRPFGGGPGMVMQIEPIYKALKSIGVYPDRDDRTKVVVTSAGGDMWEQSYAQSFSTDLDRLVIICGHYEGIDFRVVEHLADQEVSIGKYVLTGGELAAGVMVDSIARLIPGVLGNEESLAEESHSGIEKEYPHYTRPAEFTSEEGDTWGVPDTLLSGNHAEIEKWRKQNSK